MFIGEVVPGREELLLRAIEQEREDYTPWHPETVRTLGATCIVAVVGPSGSGKNTCLAGTERLDPERFHKVQSFTDRPRRPGEEEGAYEWRTRTVPNLESTLWGLRYGEIVQLAVFETGDIYWSEASEYKQEFSLLDAMASSIDSLRKLPARDLVEIGLIAPPDQWWQRMYERLPQVGQAKFDQRLHEARDSVGWMVKEVGRGVSLPIIINSDGAQEQVSKEIARLATREPKPDDIKPENLEVAEELLKSIIKQLSE